MNHAALRAIAAVVALDDTERRNKSDRRTRLLEDAVTAAALENPRETSAIMPDFEYSIERFNSVAEKIDRELVPGLFGLRWTRKSAIEAAMTNLHPDVRPAVPIAELVLDYLAVTQPDGDVWMSNFVFIAFYVSEATIKHQATGREGWWNKVLRKRVRSQKTKQALAFREQQEAADEKLRAIWLSGYQRVVQSGHDTVEAWIRADPADKDTPSNWPYRWRGGHFSPVTGPHKRRGGIFKLGPDDPTGGAFRDSAKQATPLIKYTKFGQVVADRTKYKDPLPSREIARKVGADYGDYLKDSKERIGSAKSAETNTGDDRIARKKALKLIAVDKDLTSGDSDEVGKKASRLALDEGLTLNLDKKGRGKLGDPLA